MAICAQSPLRWRKRGLLFAAEGQRPWMSSHAAVPFGALPLAENLRRIFISTRDADNRARVGWIDVSFGERLRVEAISAEPAVDLGPLGSYEDAGVIGSWLTRVGRRLHLYYSGITLGLNVPFYFFTGLAISDDGGTTFRKFSPSPILARDPVDPYLTGQVCVLREDSRWRMWYVSGTGWKRQDVSAATDRPDSLRHYYQIKYAESDDGIQWRREGRVSIDYQNDYAIGSPSVLKDEDGYRMWYCYRGDAYRIGYAESADGLSWQRRDDRAGIELSDRGWDSEMLAYPFVFRHNGNCYMLYNGNDYGRTGLGWAIADS